MSSEKFSLIRVFLGKLGLSKEAVDDVVDLIGDFLGAKEEKPKTAIEFPYHLRDNFLSNAEISFYHVVRTVVGESAQVFSKVSLGDIFYVKSSDASKYRVYTNKIDRKHVDFLLCNPKAVRPFLGIELDDKSHQRNDRQERDQFVDQVFAAAGIPLVRVPVKHTYSLQEVQALLQPYIQLDAAQPLPPDDKPQQSWTTPRCTKCGAEMVMRSAKSGPNQGKRFWGCSNYPRCKNVVAVEE
jgi:very-short-patch-repair endonuclease